MSTRKKEILTLLLVFLFFLASSYLAQRFEAQLAGLLVFKSLGSALVYIFSVIFAAVTAPFATLPLLPVAVAIWGPLLTAIFYVIGSLIGSYIAFYLARRWGQKLLCRLFKKGCFDDFGYTIEEKNLFWLIVLARLILPADVASYSVGLLTEMKTGPYLLATFIGILPFAFIFAYGAKLDIRIQIVGGILLIALLLLGYKRIKKSFRKK